MMKYQRDAIGVAIPEGPSLRLKSLAFPWSVVKQRPVSRQWLMSRDGKHEAAND